MRRPAHRTAPCRLQTGHSCGAAAVNRICHQFRINLPYLSTKANRSVDQLVMSAVPPYPAGIGISAMACRPASGRPPSLGRTVRGHNRGRHSRGQCRSSCSLRGMNARTSHQCRHRWWRLWWQQRQPGNKDVPGDYRRRCVQKHCCEEFATRCQENAVCAPPNGIAGSTRL